MRHVRTSLWVGDSTDAIDPRALGTACVGERLVALARVAAAMHMAMAAEHAPRFEPAPGGSGGESAA